MIKFFRSIRQSLIMENKTAKYLKYAIGEIILVVIGILIALQINNWHQGELRLKQEKILLTQLRLELLDIYGDVFSDLASLNESEKSHFKVLDYLKSDLPFNDSMCLDFYLLKLDQYIYPNKAVYDKIKEIGLDIISKDSIRINVQKLYENIFPRISKSNSYTRDISEYLDPYYVEHFTTNTNYNLKLKLHGIKDSLSEQKYNLPDSDFPTTFEVDGKTITYTIGFKPIDFENLKKDNRYLMLLNEVDGNRAYKIDRYKMAKNLIRKVVTTIDSIQDRS